MDFPVKQRVVKELAAMLRKYYPNIKDIELRRYIQNGSVFTPEEFILLTWQNGGYSTADNNCNSVSATVRNVARMIDGGVYENWELYTEIMEEKNGWERIG